MAKYQRRKVNLDNNSLFGTLCRSLSCASLKTAEFLALEVGISVRHCITTSTNLVLPVMHWLA